MIVTVHDYGTIHGGINWSNPRDNEGLPLADDTLTAEEHEAVCAVVVAEVSARPKRPAGKATYDFQLRGV